MTTIRTCKIGNERIGFSAVFSATRFQYFQPFFSNERMGVSAVQLEGVFKKRAPTAHKLSIRGKGCRIYSLIYGV